MTSLQQAQALLPEMTKIEKIQLLQSVTAELGGIVPGIEKIPGVCGGDACIIRTRIPVWLLVNWKKLGLTDEELLADYPSLRPQDLENVWAYYNEHYEEIESNIRENNEA